MRGARSALARRSLSLSPSRRTAPHEPELSCRRLARPWQHHKDRIVLLTASNSTEAEVRKYLPAEHMPPHLRETRK